MRHHIHHIYLALLLAILTGIATYSLAWTVTYATTTTLQITGMGLSELAQGGTPPTVLLNGTNQSIPFQLSLQVTDASGLGAGWSTSITSTSFTTTTTPAYTLPDNSTTITGVTGTCNTGSTCVDPTTTYSYPQVVPAAAGSPPAAIPFYNATQGTGMGSILVTITLQLAVLPSAFSGTYSSTFYFTVNAGP